MNPSNFGKNLKDVLRFLEMTQADLAENAGLTPAAISQIIAGKREPSLTTICLIMRVVPVKFERLVALRKPHDNRMA